MDKKMLLAAINAQYYHSNPAVYSLRAFAEDPRRIDIAEYTVNQRPEEILEDLYRRRPAALAFSCYIWNRAVLERLLADLPKVLPEVPVFLGGPEVSYDAPAVLEQFPGVTAVLCGEGEVSFRELCGLLFRLQADHPERKRILSAGLASVPGLCFRSAEGEPEYTPLPPLLPGDAWPFIYEEYRSGAAWPGPFANKLLYYESSRGCPFRCSYCLSSIDRTVRFRSTEKVFAELDFFLEKRVKLVKFADRTFNADPRRAREIWQYLQAHDNGVTGFHFEIAADLLGEDDLALLEKLRPGLVQLEIGVQTTDPAVLRTVNRRMDMEKLKYAVRRIKKAGNIHQHLDLIAGLPGESLDGFRRSFDETFELGPDDLQLGFLKILKGSPMAEAAADRGILASAAPPYEVLATPQLPYGDLLELKQIEDVLEIYYNSGQFVRSLPVLSAGRESAFDFFRDLAAFMRKEKIDLHRPARILRYEALRAFGGAYLPGAGDRQLLQEALLFDLYARELLKKRPSFAPPLRQEKNAAGGKMHTEYFYYLGVRPEENRTVPRETPLRVTFTYLPGERGGEHTEIRWDPA